MMVPGSRFNINLVLLVLLAVFGTACKTSEEKEKSNQATFLRFHLETNPIGPRHSMPGLVYRNNPMEIYMERDAVLDEGFMLKAEMVDADEFGNHAIKIIFDETGTQRLDYLTTSYRGRRLVVNCRWTENRLLGAPLITRRITDGVFVFTPDASREETERIVAGLNNVIAKLKKPYTF